MKDLCDNNHEDHVNNEINQAMSSVHKLDNVGHLVAKHFPGLCKCPIEYRNRNLLDDFDYADHDFTEEGSPDSGESDQDPLEEYSAAELSDKDLLDGFSVVEFCLQGSSEKFPLPKYSNEM